MACIKNVRVKLHPFKNEPEFFRRKRNTEEFIDNQYSLKRQQLHSCQLVVNTWDVCLMFYLVLSKNKAMINSKTLITSKS